jgi:hypothetical protein
MISGFMVSKEGELLDPQKKAIVKMFFPTTPHDIQVLMVLPKSNVVL